MEHKKKKTKGKQQKKRNKKKIQHFAIRNHSLCYENQVANGSGNV